MTAHILVLSSYGLMLTVFSMLFQALYCIIINRRFTITSKPIIDISVYQYMVQHDWPQTVITPGMILHEVIHQPIMQNDWPQTNTTQDKISRENQLIKQPTTTMDPGDHPLIHSIHPIPSSTSQISHPSAPTYKCPTLPVPTKKS